jgi:hypothetical protein
MSEKETVVSEEVPGSRAVSTPDEQSKAKGRKTSKTSIKVDEGAISTSEEQVVVYIRKNVRRMVFGTKVYSFEAGKKYKVPQDVACKLLHAKII